MSNTQGGIQFERAEFAAGEATTPSCAFCKRPLTGSYYEIAGQAACEHCKLQAELDRTAGSGLSRFARAASFGMVAALAGSALWYAVRVTTGYEIGLIAVLVGLLVGAAVRAGSHRRGGLLYQLLAVALTYFGICAQYMPDVWKGLREGATAESKATPGSPDQTAAKLHPTLSQLAVAVAIVLAIAAAAPFLAGFQNLIGILIIGFALWEAWKLNRAVPLTISGPFRLGETRAPSAPAFGVNTG